MAALIYLDIQQITVLKYRINKQEVRTESEKVDLSLGREQQVVSGNRHQVTHWGKLKSGTLYQPLGS